ncbi:MAG: class I SAM-dependent methyltransferase [Alphaproteobacteria bacterium]|nr:class I SAM-dependent methyltransferase [Alphaproteobacteria bacterium]
MQVRTLRASSWSPLDGDGPLRYPRLLALHLVRRLEAFMSAGTLPGYRSFRPRHSIVTDAAMKHTPSRQICIDFLKSLDFALLKQRLGPLHVFDIGCGRGDYARYFLDAGAQSYRGADAVPRKDWNAVEDSRVSFQAVECGKEQLAIPEHCNLIFSQSALEHIRWDVSLMQDVSRHCQAAERPVMQLHMLPAPASISLYGAHGWRVYAAAQVARLVAPFGGADVRVYGMGSRRARALYYRRYADNRFFRVLAQPWVPYRPDRKAAGQVTAQQAEPSSQRDADFLALMITTGLRLPYGLVHGASA